LVLYHVLSDAVKFQPEDEDAHVEIELEENEDAWVFTVRDDGIGFDPAYADRVFEMFERLAPDTGDPGTGVGLAICKKAVDQHGGRIWADSEPGEGSTFEVELPKEPEPRSRVLDTDQDPED
jgi:signal transduction histidine kinase